MKKLLLLAMLLTVSASVALSAPRSKDEMKAAARQAINKQRAMRHMAPDNSPMKVLRSMEQIEVIGSEENGFAVVAADDLMPAVLGVSTARYSGGKNENFRWWLEATALAAKHMVKNQVPMRVTTPDPLTFPMEVPTMVTSKWDQTEPYNNMCPTYNATTKCLTGCVATAMAQVLNYHKTPDHGQGTRTIYYPQHNTSGEAVTANFEDDYYDWLHMLDSYKAGNYTQQEADAVALLMRDCGVAADMQYDGPNVGSGAYSEDAADGLRQYFGFEDAECLHRDSYSEPDWMNLIYTELSENGPLYYGGSSWMSGGHAFVFDGYNAEGQVSVNWGWSGEEDGYFFISQLNPGYYDFNMGQDMIVGIKSKNHSLMRSEDITVAEAGTLREAIELTDTIENSVIGTLTVSGPINHDDLFYLRHLAGWDIKGEATNGRLRVLDLTKAELVETTLPDTLFKNCSSLRRVRLPESLTAIGREAFCGCTGLMELRVISKKVPELKGAGVFEGLPFGTAKLYVYSGLKTKYVQAAQWSEFGENNIYQVGTSVKVRNAIRFYGEDNPEFYYNVSGEKIEGKPVISCEATKWSPAGRYPITVAPGTVKNAELVNFIDGYIIVRKVDGVKATVVDVEREEGQPNPEFQLSYEGLLDHDAEPVWLQAPVFETAANEASIPGIYMVSVASGEAESYGVEFISGKITVTAKPVPDGISTLGAAEANAPLYNLQGQRVNASRKGLFIRNGKKVVK
ncbi:MAG: C10 family peptidase [Prevotella sp.]|nr:C10 family peptidase [Prevotella sp.]